MRGLLSAADLSRDRIERLLHSADAYGSGGGRGHPGAVVGLLFFEESLRTRAGFEAAAARLQAGTLAVGSARQGASMEVPETLEDTLRSVAGWCDVICLRHASPDAPARCAALSTAPIVNCGNGNDEHPVQALVDLYAIKRLTGRIDDISLAMVGDLSAMRTAHSLALALTRLSGWRVRCIAPRGLGLAPRYLDALRATGHDIESTTSMDVGDIDVLYVAGLPADTAIGRLHQEEQALYCVDRAVVERMPAHARVLCPLPRIDEIAAEVDARPQAAYFEQSALSLAIRMALLGEQLSLRETRS
jgi:aspartate carbamoyltransferase catalytic subunit